MREIGLGCRPGDLEPRCFGPDALERFTGVADAAIVLFESAPQGL